MNRPLLTIITVTKDDPDGLTKTISSTVSLRENGAVQLVIDGSNSTCHRGKSTVSQSGVVIHRREPRGIADAFNAGLAAVDGEWIWFLNGADQVDPRLTAKFLRELLEKTQADLIIGGLTYEGKAEPQPHPSLRKRWPPFRSWIPHPATLVRRRLFEKFGPFDERYSIAMDYEWFLRVIPTGVTVDVRAEPFAIFARGGVSQRPESCAQIRREQDDALRRHHALLWRPSPSLLYRLVRAFFSPRLKQPSESA